MRFKRQSSRWVLAALFAALFALDAQAAREIEIDPPGEREFILDYADLIDEGDEQRIREIAEKLLTDKATPIIVVTIESMGEYSGARLSIERFAARLFDQWGIGHAKLNGRDWNTGILLLVSQGDRKARIELGAGWGREQDALCQRIMSEQIVARFKQGDFSRGIAGGVEALDAMARDKALPSKPRPASHYLLWAVGIAIVVFTVISISRNGQNGYAWLIWAAVFSVLGTILYHVMTSSGRSSSGGFGGGSFGGGFSGGGGATGSW